MARRNTASAKAQTAPASLEAFRELDAIQTALLTLVGHFRLADQRLYGDLAGVPDEFQPAAIVLHDATEALDALHARLDTVNVLMADLRHGPGWRERLRAEMQAPQEAVARTLVS